MLAERGMHGAVLREGQALAEQERLGNVEHGIVSPRCRTRDSLAPAAASPLPGFRAPAPADRAAPASYVDTFTAHIQEERTALVPELVF